METLEFARELKRMCDSYEDCEFCLLFRTGINCHNNRKIEDLIPFVEDWSTAHPKVTNLDHYAEKLKDIGYEVNKDKLRITCPVYKSQVFKCLRPDLCRLEDCSKCLEWWDEEFKEK